MEEKQTFGDTLRILREKSGIGSKELSRKLGKGEAYVSQIELGRNKNPDYDIAFKLMELVGHPKHQIKEFLNLHGIKSPEAIKEVGQDKEESSILSLYSRSYNLASRKIIKIRRELNAFLDRDQSRAEKVINNIHLLLTTTDEEQFNFFRSLFENDYENLSNKERDTILHSINEVFKSKEDS
jgi:transcriptional regulator with XRE-family HTH domain